MFTTQDISQSHDSHNTVIRVLRARKDMRFDSDVSILCNNLPWYGHKSDAKRI